MPKWTGTWCRFAALLLTCLLASSPSCAHTPHDVVSALEATRNGHVIVACIRNQFSRSKTGGYSWDEPGNPGGRLYTGKLTLAMVNQMDHRQPRVLGLWPNTHALYLSSDLNQDAVNWTKVSHLPREPMKAVTYHYLSQTIIVGTSTRIFVSQDLAHSFRQAQLPYIAANISVLSSSSVNTTIVAGTTSGDVLSQAARTWPEFRASTEEAARLLG